MILTKSQENGRDVYRFVICKTKNAKRELKKFLKKYNFYRPNSLLKGFTPLEYIFKHKSGDSFCLTPV